MKCNIIYFSACGNTKLAAENIKEGILESGHECEMFEMRDIKNNFDFQNSDLIGFMCPVYAWREPTIFTKFLKNLPVLNNKYAFIAATAHSDFGNIFHFVNRAIKKKGITSIAYCEIFGPSSFTIWNTDKYEYDMKEEEIQKAFKFGANLFNVYNDIVLTKSKAPPTFNRKLVSGFLSTFASNDFSLSFAIGPIKLNENLCNKCGKCAENCAWNAITIEEESFPKIDNNICGGCCACINLCPKEALGNKKTQGKIKYHEPSYNGYKKKI